MKYRGGQKDSHVIKISIEASLNRDCRNTRRANIWLYWRMLRSSNFQSASTFVEATWLRIYRSHVRVFVPCTCQRLTDFQRTLLTGSTDGETGILVSPLHYNHFQPTKSIFYSPTSINFAANWFMCRALQLF